MPNAAWWFDAVAKKSSGMPLTDLLLGMEADGTGGGGSTMYQDAAGTMPCTTTGQFVKSWLDPVSTYLVANSSCQATYLAAGINGLPSFNMTGSVGINFAAPVSLNVNVFTFWMVVLPNSLSGLAQGTIFSLWSTSGWIAAYAYTMPDVQQFQIDSAYSSAGAVSVASVYCFQYNGATGVFATYQDGTLIQSGTTSTFTNGLAVPLGIGELVGFGLPYAGQISALAMQSSLNTPVDSGTGQAMQLYLQTKYGTP